MKLTVRSIGRSSRAPLKIFATLAAVMITALASVHSAEPENNHLREYRAFKEALNKGDLSSAVQHAEQAWVFAEKELGGTEKTAILAYNYADLVYYDHPEKGIAPLRRVIELTGEGAPAFGAERPELILRLIEAASDEESRSKEKSLKKLLKQDLKDKTPPSLIAARSWLWLSGRELKDKHSLNADKSIEEAIINYQSVGNGYGREYALALYLGGVIPLQRTERSASDIEKSVQRLDKAISLYGPQTNIENFDPMLAKTLAWRLVAKAAAQSDLAHTDSGVRKLKKVVDAKLEMSDIFGRKVSKDLDCSIRWEEQKKPTFPYKEQRKGLFGGVIIGYRLGKDKKVLDARIIGEVPNASSFGQTALDHVKKWRAKELPPANCDEQHLVSYVFTIF